MLVPAVVLTNYLKGLFAVLASGQVSFDARVYVVCKRAFKKLLLFLTAITLCLPANADVVKPALVEVSVFSDGSTIVEIRTSVEALLTGINGRYRNTQEAPNSEEYDRYRKLGSRELKTVFEEFYSELLDGISLTVDGMKIPLSVGIVDVPPPGYTKVPRTSIIELVGEIPDGATSLRWYYPLRFGDQAVRVRQVNESSGEYHWSGYQWIKKDEPSKPFSLTEVYTKPTFWSVAYTYQRLVFYTSCLKGWTTFCLFSEYF